ncbi:MAG TPA: type VI secretion system tip protein VgrG [Candidatus Acidoferrum sp.]|jgi:type VI secretion system secreted protein VgrG|nr:type VI secretion system tip protein VgrG [Candidatus Acidoferrum sp.]
MPVTQKSRLLAIGTVLEDDKLVLERFSLTEQLGRLFQIEVELGSEDPAIKFDEVVGTNATIRLELPEKKTRYFNGFISRFVQTEQQRNYAHYRATLVPWLWFLTRTADCRIFQKKKVPDIIEEVFKAQGFNDYKPSLSGTYDEWEYCVQYRETDFNFVSRLMEQEGIYYFFQHENGKHTLVLADSDSAHSPFPDYEDINYRPRVQGEQTEESISDWVIEQEVQPGAYVVGDFNFTTPGSPILGSANISRQHAASGFEMFDYPGEFEKRPEGDAYAKIRIQELQSQHELLRGRATSRGIATGSKFTLKSHPRTDQNRDYLVIAASYQAGTSEFESGAASQSREFYDCSFTSRPASEPFRPARLTPKPVIQGPQTAIVVGKKGEEIDTDEFGRVKVQFHWDRYGKVDENSSCFVRVSHAAAGKSWGAINLPRIGQEVIVEFLEGDPDRPIITGRVYNATATPPYKLPDFKTVSTHKSNSSKGGQGFNELRFEDKKGEEQIFMHGEKNLDIRIKNDAFETIENDRHLVVTKDQIEHVKNNRSETVDADHMEKIGKDRHLNVVGKEAKAVGGSLSLTVSGDVIEVFKANHSEQTTSDYYLKGDNVVIEGMTNVTIKVGGSSIAIAADGIALKTDGTVKVESSGTMDLKADAPLAMQSSATAELKSPMTTVKGDGQLTLKGGVVMIN